jgi:hypothetical protein
MPARSVRERAWRALAQKGLNARAARAMRCCHGVIQECRRHAKVRFQSGFQAPYFDMDRFYAAFLRFE